MRHLITLLLLATAFQTANALVIDDYIVGQSLQIVAEAPPASSISDSTVDSAVLGGERDLVVTKIIGADDDRVRVRVNPNGQDRLRYSTDSGVNADALVVYDGVDGDASVIDYDGLNVDLYSDGSTGFHLDVLFSNIGGPVALTVYDRDDITGATFASAVFDVPADISAVSTVSLYLPFTSFASSNATLVNAIFDSVGAITMLVDGSTQAAWDGDFALFGTTTVQIPVPAGAFLLLSGLILLPRKKKSTTKN